MLAHHAEQRHENLGGAGHDVAALEKAALAGEVAHQAARLQDQQGPGGHVPRLETEFPETVEAAARHVGQIERRRARAADAGGLLRQIAEDR